MFWGISGGQDSTLAGRLAQLAVEEMRAETGDDSYCFIAVRLPYGIKQMKMMRKSSGFINLMSSLTSISRNLLMPWQKAVEAAGAKVSDFNKGNIKARNRMITFRYAGRFIQRSCHWTDHAAENVTAFFHKFGDGGADILPLYRLNKRQGKLLAAFRSWSGPLWKVPTADLAEEKPGIADEVALGVTYNEIRRLSRRQSPFQPKPKKLSNLGGHPRPPTHCRLRFLTNLGSENLYWNF